MNEQRTPEEQLRTAHGLLREWLCASTEFNLEDWARRVRDFVEDEFECDHESGRTVNADGCCLVCGRMT
jgi:hypothetical protein